MTWVAIAIGAGVGALGATTVALPIVASSTRTRLLPFVPTRTDLLTGASDRLVDHQAALHRLVMLLTEAWNARQSRRLTRRPLRDLVDRSALAEVTRELDEHLDQLEAELEPLRQLARLPAPLAEHPVPLTRTPTAHLELADLDDEDRQWLQRLPGVGQQTPGGTASAEAALQTWLGDDGLRAKIRDVERAMDRLTEDGAARVDRIGTHPPMERHEVGNLSSPPDHPARTAHAELGQAIAEVRSAWGRLQAHFNLLRDLTRATATLAEGAPELGERALLRRAVEAHEMAFPSAALPLVLPPSPLGTAMRAGAAGLAVGVVLGGITTLVLASL